MRNIKILLVDDHKLIRDGLRLIIDTTPNIDVMGECTNGREAIQYLEKNEGDIDVVVMDITMPDMNGIDATEIILDLYPKINILALSMHSEEAYIMKMIKAGAKGYLLKDSGSDRLVDAIEAVNRNEKYYSKEVSLKLINLLVQKDGVAESIISERETEILKMISNGSTNKEVADHLSISCRTVESHRRNIIKKLNLKNTAGMIKYAYDNNLVSN